MILYVKLLGFNYEEVDFMFWIFLVDIFKVKLFLVLGLVVGWGFMEVVLVMLWCFGGFVVW